MYKFKSIFLCLLFPILLQAQESSKELLVRTCKLSILGQEITKAYIAASLRIDRAAQIRKIQDNALTLEDDLHELSVTLPSFQMQELLTKVNSSWKKHKKIVLKAYNKKNFSKLEKSNKQLLADCKALCTKLTAHVNRRGKAQELTPEMMDVDLIEVLREQTILCQSISSYFFTKAWGLEYQMTNMSYHGAIIKYEKNLQHLIEMVDLQPKFADLIDESLLHWCTMEGICTKLGGPSKNKADLMTILKMNTELLNSNNLLMDGVLML